PGCARRRHRSGLAPGLVRCARLPAGRHLRRSCRKFATVGAPEVCDRAHPMRSWSGKTHTGAAENRLGHRLYRAFSASRARNRRAAPPRARFLQRQAVKRDRVFSYINCEESRAMRKSLLLALVIGFAALPAIAAETKTDADKVVVAAAAPK